GPARRGRRVRVRDARRHGRGARSDLRVRRSPPAPPAVDELEVKARVEDPNALRTALMRAGAVLEFRGDMLDRRFDRDAPPTLTERDEVLRLRVYRQADGVPAYGMLGWKGPHSKRGRYRRRAETEVRVGDPEGVVTILARLGFAVSLRIDRRVEVYRLGGAGPLRVPELASSLGRLLVPRRLEEPWVPLDDLREELATRVMELGGQARAAAAGEAREQVLEAVSRRAWLAAWEAAVRQAAARVTA